MFSSVVLILAKRWKQKLKKQSLNFQLISQADQELLGRLDNIEKSLFVHKFSSQIELNLVFYSRD